jgi:cell wall-associated NlpC family hydrolase
MRRSENMKGSRREFLRRIGLLAGVSMVGEKRTARAASILQDLPLTDEQICRRKFEVAARESLAGRPIGEIMVSIGASFLGTPYEAHTLEEEGPERLIVNLRGLDCVTFVETTLALSRCVKLGTGEFSDYAEQLRLIRYRKGIIDGYPSRLHYFSEWILENARKGLVADASRELGGVPFEQTTNFMSEHRSSYRQLSDNAVLGMVSKIEEELSRTARYYIPKEIIAKQEIAFRQGDIIGITTSVEGLDIAHTGIVVESNGAIRYLHAPLSGGVVQITESTLSEYLQKTKGRTGVMVARPLEPS